MEPIDNSYKSVRKAIRNAPAANRRTVHLPAPRRMSARSEATQRPTTRVLLVDDEPTIRRALEIMLRRTGYEVAAAGSGEEAVALVRTEPFDHLVLDLRIPDMRGDVAFELAASVQPHLRSATVFTTGDSSARAQELIAACGCPLLAKPFEFADLIAVLRRANPYTDRAWA